MLEGNIYFVGGGDPLLREPSYAASVFPPGSTEGKPVFTNVTDLVGDLKARGVHEVTGSVVGDDARYDSLTSVPGWPARYVEEGDVGAMSALGIDDGFAEAGPPVPEGAPPAVQSAGVLTDLLRSAGIDVDGAPTEGQLPAGTSLIAETGLAPARRDPGGGAAGERQHCHRAPDQGAGAERVRVGVDGRRVCGRSGPTWLATGSRSRAS